MSMYRSFQPGLRSMARFAVGVIACAFIAATVAVTPTPAMANQPEIQPLRSQPASLDPREIEEAARSGKPVSVDLLGEKIVLLLEPSSLRSARFFATRGCGPDAKAVPLDSPRTFKGTVQGDPTSVVRLSTCNDQVRGYIKDAEGWIFIDPSAVTPSAQMAYTEEDLDPSVLVNCASAVIPDAITAESTTDDSDTIPPTREAIVSVMELAVEADYEYYQQFGPLTLAQIETVMNEVDGIYQAELGIAIELVNVTIWDEVDDPFTTDDASALLGELRSHWLNDNAAIDRDLVHLFTGRDLDGSTVGIAYLGVVCSNGFGYGLSQRLNPAYDPLVVAHEIGHNLGADHDPTGTPDRYIMYPSISSQNLDEFSAESEDEVDSYLAGVGCMHQADTEDPGGIGNPVGGVDPPPSGGGGGGSSGGPVDPAVLLLALAAAYSAVRRSR